MEASNTIKKETLRFLENLKKNNNREWFNENKEKYLAANDNFLHFVQGVIDQAAKFDESLAGLSAKGTVFRIYRDIRFSKDKTPYKTGFGATLMGKTSMCGNAGYYLHLEPGNAFLAGGVHMPEPKEMKAIREAIKENGKKFLKIINDKTFRENFTLEGKKAEQVPRGFDTEDTMAEYLKYKELMAWHPVSDKEILSDGFADNCVRVFKAMMPFNQFLLEPLMALK